MDRAKGQGQGTNQRRQQAKVPAGNAVVVKNSEAPLQRARRPGYSASMKRQINVVTNLYRLNFNRECFYHYDIDIQSKDARPRSNGDSIEKLPGKDKCRQILFEVIKRKKQLQEYTPVYDGQKNMFTCKPLPIGEDGYQSEIALPSDRREQRFVVSIKPVVKKHGAGGNAISLRSLENYVLKRSIEVPNEVRMVLDAILAHRPMNSTEIRVVNSFFPSNPRKVELNDGCDVWFGFSQTIRFTEQGAAVVVNTAAMAFHRTEPLIEKVRNMFRINTQTVLNHSQLEKLNKTLKSLRVQVTHQRYRRKYRIQGIAESARKQQFEMTKDGKTFRITVEDFLQCTYEKRLQYPHLPCLRMESKKGRVYIPIEVCEVVAGQRVGKLDPAKAAKMIQKTAIPPEKKFCQIQEHAREIADNNTTYTRGYGIEVELDPIVTTARVLREPTIQYAQNQKCRPNDRGVWKITGQNFAKSPSGNSKRWKLVSFLDEMDYSRDKLKHLASLLCEEGKKLGLSLDFPRIDIVDNRMSVKSVFEQAKEGSRWDFLVFVVSPKDRYHSYEEVKFLGDVKYSIPTQCIDGTKEKLDRSKITNICLKINTKLGGINHFISEWPIALQREGVIVFGADVVHNVAVGCPSVAAVVASIDFTLTRYAVSCCAQTNPRGSGRSQEIIIDLKEMVRSLLVSYYKSTNKRKPAKILFYRDGVSEGQYDHVLQHEIPMIKAACRSLSNDYQPPITFLIVQKRHPVRVRPENPSEGVGQCANVPPGTTIDTDIVDPSNHDFYLCSHEGIQGTSKPAHYTVLFDENGVKPEVIEELSYFLCHVCARCNRSISIPTPVKYADLLSYRAGMYVKHLLQTSSVGRFVPGGEIPVGIQELMASIKNIEAPLFFI